MFLKRSLSVLALYQCVRFASTAAFDRSGDQTLLMTNVIFRHGAKIPEYVPAFTGNRHQNRSYFPYENAELSPNGRQLAFTLGKELRMRYSKFLGNVYYSKLVESRTSDTHRTKSTLLCVHAGLFPPRRDQVFVNGLEWQPVPYTYSEGKDTLILPESVWDYLPDVEDPHNMKDVFERNAKMEIKKTFEMMQIADVIQAQSENGLGLPDWVLPHYPQPFLKAGYHALVQFYDDPQVRHVLLHDITQKIIGDAQKPEKGEEHRKMYLYSAHDVNVAMMLSLFHAYDGNLIPYTAYFIIEVHNKFDTIGVMLFYKDYTKPNAVPIKVPGCDDFCPLDVFEKYVQEQLLLVEK